MSWLPTGNNTDCKRPATASRRRQLLSESQLRRTAALLAGAVALVACNDATRVTEPETSSEPGVSLARQLDTDVDAHPGEAPFRTISSIVPSFGGYFFDDEGNLVALVTDPGDGAAVRVALEPVLQENNRLTAYAGTGPQPEVVIREGQYSFVQLAEWRDRLRQEVLLQLGDAVSLDVDEGRNRVGIGLATGSGRTDVERKLAELGIPGEAVVFDVTGRIVSHVDSLEGRVRPVEGGLRIWDEYKGKCTFGFNARWNGLDVFLTASHCTQYLWGTDYTDIYQDANGSQNYVGYEYHDPEPNRCGFLWWRHDCFHSDASIILHETTNFSLGFIARTDGRASAEGGQGSIYIDAVHPRIEITAKKAYPSAGNRVDIMAPGAGWSWGKVPTNLPAWTFISRTLSAGMSSSCACTTPLTPRTAGTVVRRSSCGPVTRSLWPGSTRARRRTDNTVSSAPWAA